MNKWFLVKVKYTKQQENGTFKRVTEPYLISAMTFSDAETRIYEELGDIIRGEFLVLAIATMELHDIFHYEESDVWYTCKILFDGSIDGEGNKKTRQTFLLTADSVVDATSKLKESLSGLMVDFEITGVAVSPIVDVFPYKETSEEILEVEFEEN
jgi:hypothetical protein